MTTTTRKLEHNKGKEKVRHPEKIRSCSSSRMKRFLSSLLFSGTIALSSCGSDTSGNLQDAGQRDSIAKHDSAKDSASDANKCYFTPQPFDYNGCYTGGWVGGRLGQNETFLVGRFGVLLEPGLINVGNDQAVMLQIIGEGCKVLARESFVRGQKRTFSMDYIPTEFDVTVGDIGTEAGCATCDEQHVYALIFVTSTKYSEKWALPECTDNFETYVVTLGEGQSSTVNGWTVTVNEIVQNGWLTDTPFQITPPSCTIIDERASFTVTYPGASLLPTYYLPETGCFNYNANNGCINIYIKEINQFVQERNNECVVSNENVTLTLKVSTP